MRLIENWHREIFRLWSMRIALFWMAVGASIVILPAFADLMPRWAFALAFFIASMSFGIARLLKQPGTN